MIACPHPDCDDADDLTIFEVATLYGVTGARMYVTCPAGHRFEVEIFPCDLAPDPFA